MVLPNIFAMAQPTRVLLEALSTAGLLAAIPQVIKVFRRFADRVEGRIDVSFVFATTPSDTLLATLTQRAKARKFSSAACILLGLAL